MGITLLGCSNIKIGWNSSVFSQKKIVFFSKTSVDWFIIGWAYLVTVKLVEMELSIILIFTEIFCADMSFYSDWLI